MKKILLSLLLLCSGMGFAQNHWTPENNSFEDYMSMYVVVQFYGVDMASSFLEIGAFCGDECRGSVLADYCPPVTRYVFYLPVYGNDGETLRFMLYDHQQEKELENLVTDELVYDYEGYGLGDNPYLMNFTTANTGSQPSANVSIELSEGWNWISNLLTTETSLEDALVNLTPAEGDIIKGQNSFRKYENGHWEGALNVLTPGKGYLYMREGEATTFTYPENESKGLRVLTISQEAVRANTASLQSEVMSDNRAQVIVRGVCWSTNPNPTVEGAHTTDGYGYGCFTSTLTDLAPNTTYYVRPYAMTLNGVCYGQSIELVTESMP